MLSWDAAQVVACRPRMCLVPGHGPMVVRLYRVGPFAKAPPRRRADRTAENHERLTRPHIRWTCAVDGCWWQEVEEVHPPLPPHEERGMGRASSA